jgi:hypothetical protein
MKFKKNTMKKWNRRATNYNNYNKRKSRADLLAGIGQGKPIAIKKSSGLYVTGGHCALRHAFVVRTHLKNGVLNIIRQKPRPVIPIDSRSIVRVIVIPTQNVYNYKI